MAWRVAQDAEVVALLVGEHDERFTATLANVGPVG
jgi:hypothetical protein